MNFWETIHGPLDLGARNVSHIIKCVRQQLGFGSECEVKCTVLFQVLPDSVDRLNTEHRRVDHQLNSGLTDGVAAEFD